MVKKIKVVIDNIKKAKDYRFVNSTIDSIIESLHDFPNTIEQIGLHRDTDLFVLNFILHVSKTGDLIQILIEEWLSCILQTEPNINVSIYSSEESDKYDIELKLMAHSK